MSVFFPFKSKLYKRENLLAQGIVIGEKVCRPSTDVIKTLAASLHLSGMLPSFSGRFYSAEGKLVSDRPKAPSEYSSWSLKGKLSGNQPFKSPKEL